jgi:hypothetical protein
VVIGHVKSGQSLHVEKPVQPVQQTPSSQSQPDNPPTVKTASLSDPSDYFQNVADKYELQLSGIAEGQTDKGFKFMAMIDALDDNHHLKERFTVKELESMGWQVVRTEYGILVSHGKSSYVVRQRPRDYFGQVSQNVRNSPEISGQK